MRASETALPRLRVKRRRWKPPSQRQIFYLVWMANELSIIGRCIYRPNASGVLMLFIWSAIFVMDHHEFRRTRQIEKDEDAVLPPVPPSRWFLLAVLTLLQPFSWMGRFH
jgi:hypothetical protein